MSILRGLWRRLRRSRQATDRLIARSEWLNERQRDLTLATGNYLRDSYLGVRPPMQKGTRHG